MTPPAARGIIEAIYWKPAIKYIIDKIYVLNPIEYAEVTIDNRKLTVLKDVRYVIKAHFDLTERAHEKMTEQRYYARLMANINAGQFHHQPYFGYREFPVSFRYMLYDMDFSDPTEIRPLVFKAVLIKGVLNLDTVSVC